MNIFEATKSYEHWLGEAVIVVSKDLRDKHAKLREDPFQFLRGTYYRWAQTWPGLCHQNKGAPVVLSAGDLHIDSYGTWRDAEGRLCWGIDDFDEAWPLPYTNDLTRLATSVKIAKKLNLLTIRFKRACAAILKAYEQTLQAGGCPVVLAEEETHLERLGIDVLKSPTSFWQKLTTRPSMTSPLPSDARKALEASFPGGHVQRQYRVVRREAGLGSLGQIRYVAIADCNGGWVAREAKNVPPSANQWLQDQSSKPGAHFDRYYEKTMTVAKRSADPFQKVVGAWLIRRLSPDSNPILVENFPKIRDEEVLLKAMGTEIANVHLGSRSSASRILRHLRARKPDWLASDARKMAKAFIHDWKQYSNAAHG
jgi:hypothetical protein